MVPFAKGGYRNVVDWLALVLQEHGHHVETVYLPQSNNVDNLFRQLGAYRWIHLEDADRIICFRPQAHLIPHPHKILWFIHHIREFYDLWDHPEYRLVPDNAKSRGIRNALHSVDTRALQEARKIFTSSRVISDRLKKSNDIESEVLYPPIFQSERFSNQGMNDELLCVCRMAPHKRQHLLVEAMAYVKTSVRLRLCGPSSPEYAEKLNSLIRSYHLQGRVTIDDRWIGEEEKVQLFGSCFAAAYLPRDEDFYGYPTLEAAHSSKALLTTTDAGAVSEFVVNGHNGCVAEPVPQEIASSIDALYNDRQATQAMGDHARDQINKMGISWSHVLERLLS
ncbi:glycosyl transferase, group 1 family protein LpsD [Blastopirellula marina DSM 3645]|uniref:Glycosyl transferase, group 1 family protein LpsD n=2 Tax=Blastopirellula marina TaxID=124 RepID=A4A136_9BACT|nr:glycosyl transferase, group 1 family protein LpsD [Blastopirellula marina DSM 3645]